jgi:hypothetical protein
MESQTERFRGGDSLLPDSAGAAIFGDSGGGLLFGGAPPLASSEAGRPASQVHDGDAGPEPALPRLIPAPRLPAGHPLAGSVFDGGGFVPDPADPNWALFRDYAAAQRQRR